MTEYLGGNKFTLALWALNTQITCHVKVPGMVCHQPWLNQFVANRALHLTVGVLVQVLGSAGPTCLGLDWRTWGREHSGGAGGFHCTLPGGRG